MRLRHFQYTNPVPIAAHRYGLCHGTSQAPPGRTTALTTRAAMTETGT